MQGTYHGLGIPRLQANTETGVAGSWTKQCTNCFLKQTGKTWNLDGIVDLNHSKPQSVAVTQALHGLFEAQWSMLS